MRPIARPLDGQVICPLQNDESQLPKIRQGRPTGKTGARGSWEFVPGYDTVQEACHVKFELHPGFSALLYSGGACSDYKKFLDGAQFESTLEYLKIESRDGMAKFTNWETSKRFVRISKDLCLYEVS
jgi:hypothetical protein